MSTWPIPRAPGSNCAGHLDDLVTAYVDRRLDPASLLRYDRHLVGCETCRAAADAEGEVLASLRSQPMISASLQALLLGMQPVRPRSDGTAPGCPPMSASPGQVGDQAPVLVALLVPAVGFHRVEFVPERLRTVRPSAPAQHHSPVRAAVIAGLAAGASVAAAWTLSVAATPVAPTVPTPSRDGQRVQQSVGAIAFSAGLRSTGTSAAGGSVPTDLGGQVVSWGFAAIGSSAEFVAAGAEGQARAQTKGGTNGRTVGQLGATTPVEAPTSGNSR